jgi:hypothetical protein
MRILIAIPAVLLLGACQVSKGSNEVSVSYNQEVAENTAAAVGNTAENIASDIGNDVKKTSDKLQNTDVSLKVNTNVSTENKAEKKEK